MKIKIARINKNLPLPKYQTLQSAGMDLYASIESDIIIRQGEVSVVPTGIKMQLPTGYEMQIRPRSGLAANYGVTVLNSPGTVDADFRGEIKVILINHGYEDFTIHSGDRIAQALIKKIEQVQLEEIEDEELDGTPRGSGGFGHTGVN